MLNPLFLNRSNKKLERWQYYFSRRNIAGYIGWLGHDNLGDEALFQSFKQIFNETSFIAYEPLPIELLLYRSARRRRSLFDLVFLGGGTLINDNNYLKPFSRAVQREKHSVVFGTGVRDPEFWMKFRPNLDITRQMQEWVAVLRNASFVGVRGPQSARALESYGLPQVRVVGDPAIALCSPRPETAKRTRIAAINLGCSGPMWGSQQQLNANVAEFARSLLRDGWQVEFLPMHPADESLAENFKDEFNLPQISIWRDFLSTSKTLNRIKHYDLLVGQRLHASILAGGSGVPTIALEYRPKCGDFMESIGMSQFSVRTDQADPERLLSLLQEIETDYLGHSRRLNMACDELRQTQYDSAREIINLAQNT